MKNLHWSEEELQQYVTGEMTPDDLQEYHLQHCQHCRAMVGYYGMLFSEIRNLPGDTFEEDISGLVMDRIAAGSVSHIKARIWEGAFLALICVAAGVLIWFVGSTFASLAGVFTSAVRDMWLPAMLGILAWTVPQMYTEYKKKLEMMTSDAAPATRLHHGGLI